MFEKYTYEYILEQALNRVPSDVDKRQGSIVFDAIAPACAEVAQTLIMMDFMLKITYAESSFGEWLDKRCAEMGVYREPATKAVRLGLMYARNNEPMDIPIGSKFSIETLNYIVYEKIEKGRYKLICEQAGIIGNQLYGKIIPVQNISGLGAGELADVLIPGEEDETDKRLYERYVEKINTTPYGGNIDDYKQKVRAIEGVGDCKVFPVWNGGGTVKVTVIDSDYGVPSDVLIENIQEILDPIPYQQQGLGLAPIGHLVTVVPVAGTSIEFQAKLVLKNGYTVGQMQTLAESVLKDYLNKLSQEFADSDYIIVRINQIEAKLLDIEGILDIENTTLNGLPSNIILGEEEIPIPGEVILNG